MKVFRAALLICYAVSGALRGLRKATLRQLPVTLRSRTSNSSRAKSCRKAAPLLQTWALRKKMRAAKS